jgi:hypothetical protein
MVDIGEGQAGYSKNSYIFRERYIIGTLHGLNVISDWNCGCKKPSPDFWRQLKLKNCHLHFGKSTHSVLLQQDLSGACLTCSTFFQIFEKLPSL